MTRNNVFIISGPSGAGEDSIIEKLKNELDIERVITTTTRKMRPGESEGNPYYFISGEDFQEKIRGGDFLEYAQEYNDNFYGVTKKEMERVKNSGKIGIWKIEYKGVIAAKKMFPDIAAIFINTESLKVLEGRIRKRSNVTEEYVKERLSYTKEWLRHLDIYDYAVINRENELDKAAREVADIIKKEMSK